jgi:ribosome-associated protein
MNVEALKALVIQALEDLKAVNIQVLDVRDKTSVTDIMVIASGTSSRHVKALADNVVMAAKREGMRPLGTEGEREGEWVLVDFGDLVLHVMQPATRDFYSLEKLWAVGGAEVATLRPNERTLKV